MWFNFSIGSFGEDTEAAEQLKDKVEALCGQYGLQGKTNGKNYGRHASFCGNYRSGHGEDNHHGGDNNHDHHDHDHNDNNDNNGHHGHWGKQGKNDKNDKQEERS